MSLTSVRLESHRDERAVDEAGQPRIGLAHDRRQTLLFEQRIERSPALVVTRVRTPLVVCELVLELPRYLDAA